MFRCPAVLVASSRIVRWMFFLPQPLVSGKFIGGYAEVPAAGAYATVQARNRSGAKIRCNIRESLTLRFWIRFVATHRKLGGHREHPEASDTARQKMRRGRDNTAAIRQQTVSTHSEIV